MPHAGLLAGGAAAAGAGVGAGGLASLVPLAAGIGGVGATLAGSLAPVVSGIGAGGAALGGLGFGLQDVLTGLNIARSLTSRDPGQNLSGVAALPGVLSGGAPGGVSAAVSNQPTGAGVPAAVPDTGQATGPDFRAILGDVLRVFAGQPGASTETGELLQSGSGIIDQFVAARGNENARRAAENRIALRNQVMITSSERVLQGSQERLGELIKMRRQAQAQGASTGALDKIIGKEISIHDGALGGVGVSPAARSEISKQFRELARLKDFTPSELDQKVNEIKAVVAKHGLSDRISEESIVRAATGVKKVEEDKTLEQLQQEAFARASGTAAGTRAGAPPQPRLNTVQFRAPNGDVVDAIVNLDTGETRVIGRGPAVNTQLDQLPATRQQQVDERIDFNQQAIEQIDKALNLPQGSFGVAATAKRVGREAARVSGDLLSIGAPEALVDPLRALSNIGEQAIDEAIQTNGRLAPDLALELTRSDLTEAEIIETRLAFMLANVLQPEGRLLKDTIESARKSVKLSGLFTSEQTARERLTSIRNIIERSQRGLQSSVPGAQPQAGQTQRFIFDPDTGETKPQ